MRIPRLTEVFIIREGPIGHIAIRSLPPAIAQKAKQLPKE